MVGNKGKRKKNTNGYKESFGDFGYVHYLDCDDILMDMFICQNLSKCTFKYMQSLKCHLYLRQTVENICIQNNNMQ